MKFRANSDPATRRCIIEAKRRGRDVEASTRAAARMVRVSDGAARKATSSQISTTLAVTIAAADRPGIAG